MAVVPDMGEVVQANKCRVCGCTPANACKIDLGDETIACSWYDFDHTLCNNPRCVGSIPLRDLEKMPTMRLQI